MPVPARRRPYTPARYRRRRLLIAVCGLVLLAGAGVVLVSALAGDAEQQPGSTGAKSQPDLRAATRTKVVAKEAAASLPAPLSGEAVASAGGAIYAIGGLGG